MGIYNVALPFDSSVGGQNSYFSVGIYAIYRTTGWAHKIAKLPYKWLNYAGFVF